MTKKMEKRIEKMEQKMKIVEQNLGFGNEGVQNVHFLLTATRTANAQTQQFYNENVMFKEFITEKKLDDKFEVWYAEKMKPVQSAESVAEEMPDFVKEEKKKKGKK